MHPYRFAIPVFFALFSSACISEAQPVEPVTIRIATYNVEDVRSIDLLDVDHPRLKKIAEEIAEIQADIILINEIQYDGDGDPWRQPGIAAGTNARRLVDHFIASTTAAGMDYDAFMAPSNTGIASGFDLGNDGKISTIVPELPLGGEDGSVGPQTAEGRAYGTDAFGFGMFPGQYAMALLVSGRLQILRDSVRTFQHFLWRSLPGAMAPVDPETGSAWYSEAEWEVFRLSSKSHWDVPIRVSPGKVLHILASHPTPPAFDGPEKRNKVRNHDEIRFWGEYLSGASFIVDDNGVEGGLPKDISFVILGDLNADLDEGDSIGNPIQQYLLDNPGVNGSFIPQGDREIEGLRSDDTAYWGLRVDYLLPSVDLKVLGGAVHRHKTDRNGSTQDHFPVWLDVQIDP